MLSEYHVCVADKAAVLHPCQTPVLYPVTGSTTHMAAHREKTPFWGENRHPQPSALCCLHSLWFSVYDGGLTNSAAKIVDSVHVQPELGKGAV